MIFPFGLSPLPSLAEVGGKGLSLMRMTDAGLPVPPGFVCSVDFFEPWLSTLQAAPEWAVVQKAIHNQEDLEQATTALKSVGATLSLTADQQHTLTEALKPLPDDSFFAVRSSSPEEDLEGASFAGGYKTCLGITEDTLLDALISCFVSAFDERVFIYKQQHGFRVDAPRIAVVVQQQIAADCAGVGFSLNPLTNDYDEAVIDANWGLGESVVAGMVSPDHFVVDKVAKTIVEKKPGAKETAVYLRSHGGVEERPGPDSAGFCLTDAQVLEISAVLARIETLYQMPIDIEWAYAKNKLYMLQARPITAYIPLPPEMMTEPGQRRRLYWDGGLSDGMTINIPMTPLTLDWMFRSLGTWMEPFIGSFDMRADGDPATSFMFGAGGRFYINFSQLLAAFPIKRFAGRVDSSLMDALAVELLSNVDAGRYRSSRKIGGRLWWALLLKIPRALWVGRRFFMKTLSVFWNPDRFIGFYEQVIDTAVRNLKGAGGSDLSLKELIDKLDNELLPVIGEAAFPALVPYVTSFQRIDKLFGQGSEEDKHLVDSLKMGFAGNEAVEIGIQQYRLSRLLNPGDFADLDRLTERLEKRDLPADFLAAWDAFIDKFGMRGPGELELSSSRYGDDPRLALEQISYMADSSYNPEEMQKQRVAERRDAYEKLMKKFRGRKRRRLRRIYKLMDLLGPTRDTPKYLWVLDNGAVRRRALEEGLMFVEQGRLDKKEDIFWLTLDEIDAANVDPTFDLRAVRDLKLPFYRKLEQVTAFPHLIDSRGRIGQVRKPEGDADSNVLAGTGISRGIARGRVKVLNTPREKPVNKGDVLVAYTTDPGWTPLFVNAEAVILEIGGMLQHGGVVAREYGKPCVAGIQGITRTLKDGQLVEVDGSTGVVRLLSED